MALAGAARAAVSLNAMSCAVGGSAKDLGAPSLAALPVYRLSSTAAHGVQLPAIRPMTPAAGHHAKSCKVQATVAAAPVASSAAVQEEGRVYNFAAGPACLPYNVLKEAQADLINWKVRQRDQPGDHPCVSIVNCGALWKGGHPAALCDGRHADQVNEVVIYRAEDLNCPSQADLWWSRHRSQAPGC